MIKKGIYKEEKCRETVFNLSLSFGVGSEPRNATAVEGDFL